VCDLVSIFDGDYGDGEFTQKEIDRAWKSSYKVAEAFVAKYFPEVEFNKMEYCFGNTCSLLSTMEDELAAGTYVPAEQKARLAAKATARVQAAAEAAGAARGKYVDMLYRTAHASKQAIKSACKVALQEALPADAEACVAYTSVPLYDFVSEHYYEMQDDYCRELAVIYDADPLETKRGMLRWKEQTLSEIADDGVIELAGRAERKAERAKEEAARNAERLAVAPVAVVEPVAVVV
jgi:hypothetical protein